ncbi:MAG: ATP-binding protein [Lachnospiraceae bacterium]|nr:ATP-binding protein [Lachnospiraceae bacterium]
MGVYLNSKKPSTIYRKAAQALYFIDKTDILKELIPIVEMDSDEPEVTDACGKDIRYLCITRPRRFGKTTTASMVASYFGKGKDTGKLFQSLKIGGAAEYAQHLNRHNVVYISFNEMPDECASYAEYIARIKRRLTGDLKNVFPDQNIRSEDAIWDILNDIYESQEDVEFIFVFDEWDYIYHQDFVTEEDKISYTKFLSGLLKDQPYVEMVYMTGILPIAKYSSGSELNMFCEYTMVAEEKYSEYFGFTDAEVDALYERYLKQRTTERNVTREGLRLWYDGYHTKGGTRVYNPRSVVHALSNNNLGNYWTSSGPYDEIFYYIGENADKVRDDIGLMLADIPVQANVREYAATSMNLTTRDEIFSAMVVYGFLNAENGYVSIPNRELMEKFADMVQKEPSMGNVNRLARESGRMLRATKAGDTKTMADILQFVHNTESPLNVYNDEAELASIIRWAYLQAIDYYRIEREDRAGVGYVDYIFYPFKKDDDAIILELKVNHTPEEAIAQIKDRQYELRFEGKIGQKPEYTGRILAVGIAYNKDDSSKRHECKVEILRGKIDRKNV